MAREPRHPVVLIVDDEVGNRTLVSLVLGRLGYTVLTASNGAEGLLAAKAQHPDVILLDIMMPVMDGHEMLVRLKEDRDTQAIPVIMVTARGGDQEIAASFQRGALFHLDKPYEARDLLQKIEVALVRSGAATPVPQHDHPR